MLQNQKVAETTVDAKTAEEALALAIRLQQERGERVSIEELQRTADEAGIDRISLHKALDHLSNQATSEVVETDPKPNAIAPILVLISIFMIVMSKGFPHGSEVATIMRAIGSVGIFGACFLFIKFLRQQNRL